MTRHTALVGAFVAVALSAATGAAVAQETLADRLAVCSREEDAAARLVCYDALARPNAARVDGGAEKAPAAQAATPPPPAAPPAPAPVQRGRFGDALRDADGRILTSGNWLVRRESDSMTDQPRVFLSNRGETEQGRTNDSPLMTIRCFQGRLEAFVSVGAFIGSHESRATRLRFDRAEAVSQSWSASTSGTAVFAPDARSFVERLGRSERLLMEVTAFGGERYRLAFDLVGISDVLPEIAACRRPPQPAAPPRQQGQR